MSDKKQVFHTDTQKRWLTFKWTGRFFLFFVLLMIPILILTLARGIKPILPLLTNEIEILHHLNSPIIPAIMDKKELDKYKGFEAYIKSREKINGFKTGKDIRNTEQIRAAFYVDWDPQSYYSLQKNIGKVNMVVPEWFFIDSKTDRLKMDIDKTALKLMKKHNTKIIPLINNVNREKGAGEFDGEIIHRILTNPTKKKLLIDDIVAALKKYNLQGVNIDFEEFIEKTNEPLIAFQKELYEKLHPLNYIVSQDIMPYNEDFNIKELSKYNDYLFLMAYDEHFGSSVPGSISSQRWIEKVLDETAKGISPSKIILCFAGYGYDWSPNMEAKNVTYQQALSNAKQFNSVIDFNNDTYNNFYKYTDGTVKHDVYFTDAATNYNTIRFADEYGTAGTALWRLGSEDDRLWSFYNRSLTNKSLLKNPFDFSKLKIVKTPKATPDYIGEGEVLDVVTEPSPGRIYLEVNKAEGIITEQKYVELPTKYVIKKFGNVKNQVILTFDDGPDPDFTPQILDILKKEKVPATFFVVGLQAESNLPLLNRVYQEGHEIGNHTFTHPNIALVSSERAQAEMETTRLLIEAVTGRSTILFRAPYNADAEPTTEAELKPIALSKKQNYYTIGESIDPNDWQKGVIADSIYNRVVRSYELNPERGIILFHDAGGDRQATVDALPRIIHYFKNKGVQFTTVAHLIGKTRNEVMPKVNSNLIALDNTIFSFGYWFGNFLSAAFWVAIILGLLRITAMAIMAFIQKRRSAKTKDFFNLPLVNVPCVSIIVPAYNEEVNIVKTIQNLLRQDYPSFDIIVVDDGSKDLTYKRAFEAFGTNPQVKVFSKSNGGKASALNFGIGKTKNDFVVCIDADTQLKGDAVLELIKRFYIPLKNNEIVGAVAGNVKVGNENTMLAKWQSIEYTTSQNFDRRAFDLINGIAVVPGAIGAFRKEAILKVGGFTTDTLAEDCDLTIRILRSGYRIVNCVEAIAVTEAPETIKEFMKQRFRWTYGIMQAFWKNRDACFNKKYKGLGMVSLPNILLFQIILPMIAPLADLILIFSLLWNYNSLESMSKIGIYYLVFMAVDILVSVIAFGFEKEKFGKLIWLIPQRFVYRQIMYFILFKALGKAIKGESQGWGVLTRTGNVKTVE